MRGPTFEVLSKHRGRCAEKHRTLIDLSSQARLVPARLEDRTGRMLTSSAMRGYCSGIGGRGTLLSPGGGGSRAGAGGGI